MKEFWDSRYKSEEFAYGKEPNEFLEQQLSGLTPGRIIFPADGEGRNGVYAAKHGWDVYSFDLSQEAARKALHLAQENDVEINYTVAAFDDINYEKGHFDAIALVFTHFHTNQRTEYFEKMTGWLKPGGMIIAEVFSKEQLNNYSSGGPADIDMLYSLEEISEYFKNFEILYLKKEEIFLDEGIYHNGLASVIRFVVKKQK